MKKLGCSMALAIASLTLSHANATLLSVVEDGDSASFTIPASNDLGSLAGQIGLVGAHVFATGTAPIGLTFEYLFKEASLVNSFWIGGQEIFNTRTSKSGDQHSITWSGGASALDFSFLTGIGLNVANDPNSPDQNTGSADQKFVTYWDGVSDEILLGLDDSGARRDADHDDMVVRIKAFSVSVPEPTSLALMGLGVLGASLARRRKLPF